MPKKRPATSGYARLAQADEDEEYLNDSDQDDPSRPIRALSSPTINNGSLQVSKRSDRMQVPNQYDYSQRRHSRKHSGVDLKALNARFERWADEIATKFKIKRHSTRLDPDLLEIQYSVFTAPDFIRPATKESLDTIHQDPPGMRMADYEYDEIIENVRIAIENDVHPLLISKGSSGSYFARNAQGRTTGVFKPKDEEPYATKNPKWTKWVHRNLFPCFFGRACLIPNLSYVSEAAAYILDKQLRCNLVPYTAVVSFSSKSFHYDYWDRRAFHQKRKPFPEKAGSFQVFLKGYTDATTFFKEHPWPDQNPSALDGPRPPKRSWADDCTRGDSHHEDRNSDVPNQEEAERRQDFWTEDLQAAFRQELEKLVILDYIMRNTDRGLDNWMIRIDTIPGLQSNANGGNGTTNEPYLRPVEQMNANSRSNTPSNARQATGTFHVRIGAIDNSLSWPWKHPDAWRSYPFGWLFLPVSLIGQPFSDATRNHFLPLLTSKAWWAETQSVLRKCFQKDSDFKENMWKKQLAIIKGQAWNVVESLKCSDHGPLELTRRPRVCVWDDLVDVPVGIPLTPTSDSTTLRPPNVSASHDKTSQNAVKNSLDILGVSSPDLDQDNPFNSSRQNSQIDMSVEELPSGTLSPPNILAMSASVHSTGGHPNRMPGQLTQQSRSSLDISPLSRKRTHERRMRHARRLSSSARFGGWEVGEEGDLGYAANEDREALQRKVIVERLENVKSKNPVFTCC